jgi:hypothetical protein
VWLHGSRRRIGQRKALPGARLLTIAVVGLLKRAGPSGVLIGVSIIMAVALCHGRAEAFFAQGGAALTEVCPMRTHKGVQVFNAPVNVETFPPALDVRQLFCVEWSSGANVEMTPPPRRNDRFIIGLSNYRSLEIETLGQRPNVHMHPTEANQIMSGCCTQIFDVNFNLSSVGSGWLADESKFLVGIEKDVGPQLSPAGGFRLANQQLGGYPEQERNKANQQFAALDTIDFRSAIASMLALGIASLIFQPGWTVTGGLLAIYAIFGSLLRMDLWTFWRQL